MKLNLVKDLSLLTTIDELYLKRLAEKSIWCISDGIEKCMVTGEDTLDIDMGIGNLTVVIGKDNIKYKFTPTQQLDKAIIDTIITEQNQLELVIEKNLVSKITKVYKDML